MEEDFSRYNGEGTPLRIAQHIMVDMMSEVDRICRKHNIKYWMICGTLIGAVRHKGFIPWDDDVDLGMLPSDYDKFIEVADKELSKRFFLQTKGSENVTPGVVKKMCKIRDCNSLCISDYDTFRTPYHQGISIDIFQQVLMPAIPNNFLKFLAKRISRSYGFFYYNPSLNFKNIICYFIYPLSYVFFKGIWLLLSIKKQNAFLSCPETYMYGIPTGYNTIFPLREIEFEGKLFFAPNDPDRDLKDHYGDYISLPPENQRRVHAKYIFPDMNVKENE
jgi:lipopolysaccharide cholinephosphotransferase